MRLRERLFRRGPRCPFCRDPLRDDAAAAPCAGCGVQLHAACMEELGRRCPTIGCSHARVAARATVVTTPADETPGEARRILPPLEGGSSPRTVLTIYGVILAVFAGLFLHEPRLWDFIAIIVAFCTVPVAMVFLLRWAAPTVASRVRLQPARLQPGAGLRVTVECSAALLRRLRDAKATIVRAELGSVRRGHVLLWRGVRLARLAPGEVQATFEFDPPAAVVRDRDGVWQLNLQVLEHNVSVMSESFTLEA